MMLGALGGSAERAGWASIARAHANAPKFRALIV